MRSQSLVISQTRSSWKTRTIYYPLLYPHPPHTKLELRRHLANEKGTLGHTTLSLRQQGIKASRNLSFQGSLVRRWLSHKVSVSAALSPQSHYLCLLLDVQITFHRVTKTQLKKEIWSQSCHFREFRPDKEMTIVALSRARAPELSTWGIPSLSPQASPFVPGEGFNPLETAIISLFVGLVADPGPTGLCMVQCPGQAMRRGQEQKESLLIHLPFLGPSGKVDSKGTPVECLTELSSPEKCSLLSNEALEVITVPFCITVFYVSALG